MGFFIRARHAQSLLILTLLLFFSHINASFEPTKTLKGCLRKYGEFKRGFYEDLLPWQETGITEEIMESAELMRSLDVKQIADAKGACFVISKGKVFLRGNRYDTTNLNPWIARILAVYAYVLEHVVEKFGPDQLPNKAVQLLISASDLPVSNHSDPKTWTKPYPPIVRYSRTRASPSILVPDWSPYQFWLSRDFLRQAYKPSMTWRKKRKTLVVSGFNYDRAHFDASTVRLTKWGNATSSPRMYLRDYLKGLNRSDVFVSDFFPLERYGEFFAVLHTDGIGWSNRLPKELALGSLVLREMSGYISYLDRLLRPWEHYVPVYRLRPREIIWALEWAKDNDEAARQIAEAGRELVKRYMTKDALDCYWLMFIHEMARIQKFDPENRNPDREPYAGFRTLITIDQFLAKYTPETVGRFHLTREDLEFDDRAIFQVEKETEEETDV